MSNAAEFQKCFIQSFNDFFGIDNETAMIDVRRDSIKAKNVDINPTVTNQIIVNAVYSDYDKLNLDYQSKGHEFFSCFSY